jgi:hypothetical protein
MHATGWDVKMLGLRRVHINGVKIIAWRCWNDGIDVDVSGWTGTTRACN